MCAIGRGLMSRPSLLLIDELSLGLAPLVVDNLLDADFADQPEGNDRAPRRAGRAGRPRARAPGLCARDRTDRAVEHRAGAPRGPADPPGVPGAVERLRTTTRAECRFQLTIRASLRGRRDGRGAQFRDRRGLRRPLHHPADPAAALEGIRVAPATAGLTISVVVLMIALVSSAYGSLSDAVGRKPVMVASCLLLAIPTLLCALASSFHMLLLLPRPPGISHAGSHGGRGRLHRRLLQRSGSRPQGRRLDRGLGRGRTDRPRPLGAAGRGHELARAVRLLRLFYPRRRGRDRPRPSRDPGNRRGPARQRLPRHVRPLSQPPPDRRLRHRRRQSSFPSSASSLTCLTT